MRGKIAVLITAVFCMTAIWLYAEQGKEWLGVAGFLAFPVWAWKLKCTPAEMIRKLLPFLAVYLMAFCVVFFMKHKVMTGFGAGIVNAVLYIHVFSIVLLLLCLGLYIFKNKMIKR